MEVTSKARQCSFFGKLGILCLLVTSVLRFAFLPYHRRFGCYLTHLRARERSRQNMGNSKNISHIVLETERLIMDNLKMVA